VRTFDDVVVREIHHGVADVSRLPLPLLLSVLQLVGFPPAAVSAAARRRRRVTWVPLLVVSLQRAVRRTGSDVIDRLAARQHLQYVTVVVVIVITNISGSKVKVK